MASDYPEPINEIGYADLKPSASRPGTPAPRHSPISRILGICGPFMYDYLRGGGSDMQTKTIAEAVVLAVVVITAVAFLPDFIRYMKIRSM